MLSESILALKKYGRLVLSQLKFKLDENILEHDGNFAIFYMRQVKTWKVKHFQLDPTRGFRLATPRNFFTDEWTYILFLASFSSVHAREVTTLRMLWRIRHLLTSRTSSRSRGLQPRAVTSKEFTFSKCQKFHNTYTFVNSIMFLHHMWFFQGFCCFECFTVLGWLD